MLDSIYNLKIIITLKSLFHHEQVKIMSLCMLRYHASHYITLLISKPLVVYLFCKYGIILLLHLDGMSCDKIGTI